MIKLNYYSHLVLNSKYKLLINLFIVLVIYSMLYSNNIINCMNDNPYVADIPTTAEAKEPHRPSQQMLAIKREIMTYAGSQAHYLEQIDELNQQIIELKKQKKEIENFYNSRFRELHRDARHHTESISAYNKVLYDIVESPYITDKTRILDIIATHPNSLDLRSPEDKNV